MVFIFLWDMVVGNVMDQFIDWLYSKVVETVGEFLSKINMMGAEVFELPWVEGIILFFSKFAWALFIVGSFIAVFDTVIEMQTGRGNPRDLALNTLKGFMAVSLFTILPVELYKYCLTLQSDLIPAVSGLTYAPDTVSSLGKQILDGFIDQTLSGLFLIVLVILIGYAIIKVFFANLKRSGILLAMITVGSLYMFSVPRGYMDGFIGWCKQVIALCLTTFLQTLMLVAGLMVYKESSLVGIGLMLSATEVPRIAQNFGLDTSIRFNLMSVMYSFNAWNGEKSCIKNTCKVGD